MARKIGKWRKSGGARKRPLFDSTRISHFFTALYLLFANFPIFLSLSPCNTRILHNLLGIFNKKCHKANTDGQGRGKKGGGVRLANFTLR